MREALASDVPLPVRELARPGWSRPLRARPVPAANPRPAFLTHPRLRRASPVTHHAVAAALEALGDPDPARRELWQEGRLRLGIIVTVMTGSVTYSRRFYDETIRDPASASPILFPETVFNAPASHLSAYLGNTSINYTLVGDPGSYLQGLALAALWLEEDRVDGCVVVGTEELDWLVVDASRHFHRQTICAEGAGALLLEREAAGRASIELAYVTDPFGFVAGHSRIQAARRMAAQLRPEEATEPPPAGLSPGATTALQVLLVDSTSGVPALDRAEQEAWRHWQGARLSPKRILGESHAAGSAWQCVVAVDALFRGAWRESLVSVTDPNQQAIGAAFRLSAARA
jgi:3-oxoacyl-(acyl-carrier-protein) synthase